jgi:hypothetical protein
LKYLYYFKILGKNYELSNDSLLSYDFYHFRSLKIQLQPSLEETDINVFIFFLITK